MENTVIFAPLLPTPVLMAVSALVAALIALALWRRLSGWWLRGLTALVLLTALANPSLQREDREALSDIVLVVTDQSASQSLSDRPDQLAEALEVLRTRIGALGGFELRETTLRDGEGDAGTQLMSALTDAQASEPQGRIAGAILLTDGQVHDITRAPDIPAPVHVLLTGREPDWDRRLIVRNAPAFAILGEEVLLTLRVEDQGAAPVGNGRVPLFISIDDAPPQSFLVPVGQDIEVPLMLSHGGMNVVQFRLPEADGELTDRNNAAVVQINGVRDRLRVLLVSGEPHAGERTWRNLLKSDSAVDLVHFTILRPPEKQDGVPITELSLIAFPTRELFLDKIDEFDLIIFDRYKRRGILPSVYLENVRNYIERGGAVLIAAGPDFASADSLFRSPLGEALPAMPTSRVIDRPYQPRISDIGQRHPVTAGLEAFSPRPAEGGDPGWGRWFRQVELTPTRGYPVMTGADDGPLLVLDRVGEGRVALLGSDHAWLWSRGYEGGGPQLELLRRLAHWMMKEPELEEDALVATAEGQTITVTRRLLEGAPEGVVVTRPDGEDDFIGLKETAPGRFTGTFEGDQMGLYRLADGDMTTVIALGPAAPREFEETIATADVLAPVAEARRGGVLRLADGVPTLRKVREGRPAAGRGWIGLTPRGAYLTADLRVIPLVAGWLFLLLAAGLAVAGWLREGRR
ncbi:MAG: hypothetical protein ACWA47_12315 [Brevirhabdus sp.]